MENNFHKWLVNVYVENKIRNIKPECIISKALDFYSSEGCPEWLSSIALLTGTELGNLDRILEDIMCKEGLISDSKELKEYIKSKIIEIGKLIASNPNPKNELKLIEKYLKLGQSNWFNSTTIPIFEFPYPPSGIINSEQLSEYIINNIDRVVN